MSEKWVYLFEEVEAAEKKVGGDWEDVRAFLGGKGANLAEMTRIGVPVPPGFTVTTKACLTYLKQGVSLLDEILEQEKTAMKRVETLTGKHINLDCWN